MIITTVVLLSAAVGLMSYLYLRMKKSHEVAMAVINKQHADEMAAKNAELEETIAARNALQKKAHNKRHCAGLRNKMNDIKSFATQSWQDLFPVKA